jgi:ADP-heptose:LPS heptosyltransferase
LCFIVSGLLRLVRVASPKPAVKPRRVLFIELSEMGSTILADPAMRRLRDRHSAELFFAIFASNRASLHLLDTVPRDNVFALRADGLATLAVDTLRLLWWCRRRGIDTVIDLELFSRFTALLTGLSGAANRVGFHAFHQEGLYRGEMLTHRVAYNPHIHIAKNFVALVDALAAGRPQLPYTKSLVSDADVQLAKAVVPDDEAAAMAARVSRALPAWQPGQRLVLINPNASDLLPQRRWPRDRFESLMRRILETWPDTVVLVTGSKGEAAEAEELAGRLASPRCASFAGGCKLEELPALYSLAALMVTNDSGPGHFSAVTDLPTIVLFGPETPRLYGSLGKSVPVFAGLACSPCVSAHNHRKTPCRDNVCLQAITPEQVFHEVAVILTDGLGAVPPMA